MTFATELSEDLIRQAKLVCPACDAKDIVKYGVRKGVQRYKCKPCNKVFSDNGALPGRRIPPTQVGAAISMFYEGLSYRDIQRNLDQQFGYVPSTATLYEWVRDYSKKASRVTADFKANTGDTWVVDETVIRTDEGKVWLWNVMDIDTRFLLATHLSRTRTLSDAVKLFTKAKERASSEPKKIITDKMPAYPDAIERVFGANTKHIQSEGIRSKELNNNLSERLQGTIKDRTKVMRGLGDIEAAKLFVDGFTFHYNHIKPHISLNGKTPAQVANLPLTFKNWAEIAHLRAVEIPNDATFKTEPLVKQPIFRQTGIPKPRVFRGNPFGRRTSRGGP